MTSFKNITITGDASDNLLLTRRLSQAVDRAIGTKSVPKSQECAQQEDGDKVATKAEKAVKPKTQQAPNSSITTPTLNMNGTI